MVNDSRRTVFGNPAPPRTLRLRRFERLGRRRERRLFVPRLRRRSRRRLDTLIGNYAPDLSSVPALRQLLPSPQAVVLALGLGRLAIGAGFLAAPVLSTRVLGLDTATAKRVSFLARMAAVRDLGLGGGLLAAGPKPAAVPWLLAGAGCDVVDATVILGAMRKRATGGPVAVGVSVGALGAAALGVRA